MSAPAVRRSIVSAPRPTLYHQGFALRIDQAQDGSDGYAFAIQHRALTLYASPADFRTPQSAERAARVFVDDALGSYDVATSALEA